MGPSWAVPEISAGGAVEEADHERTAWRPHGVRVVVVRMRVDDAVGMGVDAVADPTGWIFVTEGLRSVNYGLMGGEVVSGRAGLIDTVDTLEKSSVDFYAQVRSFYRQNRNAQLKGGAAGTPDFDLYADPAAAKPAPAKPAKMAP